MLDISMAGATVSINMAGLGNAFTINEFAEDADPISIPDLEVRKGAMNLNGKLLSWASPNPISISFSLIPGSKSDIALAAAIRAAHIGGRGEQIGNAYVQSLTVTAPIATGENTATNSHTKKSWTFYNGYISTGSPAQGSNGEGRATTKTYTFVFEGFGVVK